MSKKHYTGLLTLLLVVALLFTSQNKSSYSLEENSPLINSISLDLEYTTDKIALKNNIYKFIDLIDDTLIPIYEYQEGINLNDNYQIF